MKRLNLLIRVSKLTPFFLIGLAPGAYIINILQSYFTAVVK
jgi:hypothetical protein